MAYARKKTARKSAARGRTVSRGRTGGRRTTGRAAVSTRRRSVAARPQTLKIVIEHAPAAPDFSALAQPQSSSTKRKGRF